MAKKIKTITDLDGFTYTYSGNDIDDMIANYGDQMDIMAKTIQREHPNLQLDDIKQALLGKSGDIQDLIKQTLNGDDVKKYVKEIWGDPKKSKIAEMKMTQVTNGLIDSGLRQGFQEISAQVRGLTHGQADLVYGLKVSMKHGKPVVSFRYAVAPTRVATGDQLSKNAYLDSVKAAEFTVSRDPLLAQKANGGSEYRNLYSAKGANNTANLYTAEQIALRQILGVLKEAGSAILADVETMMSVGDDAQREKATKALNDRLRKAAQVKEAPLSASAKQEAAKVKGGSHKTEHTLIHDAEIQTYNLFYNIAEDMKKANARVQKGKTSSYIKSEDDLAYAAKDVMQGFFRAVMSQPVEKRAQAAKRYATILGSKYHLPKEVTADIGDLMASTSFSGDFGWANEASIETGKISELPKERIDPLGLAYGYERTWVQEANRGRAHSKTKETWNKKIKGSGLSTKPIVKRDKSQKAIEHSGMINAIQTTSAALYEWLTTSQEEGGRGLSPEEAALYGGLDEGSFIANKDFADVRYEYTNSQEFSKEKIIERAREIALKDKEKNKRKVARPYTEFVDKAIRQFLAKEDASVNEDTVLQYGVDEARGVYDIIYTNLVAGSQGMKYVAEVPGGRMSISHIMGNGEMLGYLKWAKKKGYINLSDEDLEKVNALISHGEKIDMRSVGRVGADVLAGAHTLLSNRKGMTPEKSLSLFKKDLKKTLKKTLKKMVPGISDDQINKFCSLYEIDKETGQIVPVDDTRFYGVAEELAKETGQDSRQFSEAAAQGLLLGIGAYSLETLSKEERKDVNGAFFLDKGVLRYNPGMAFLRGKAAQIDQSLEGGSNIKESGRTLDSMQRNLAMAERISGKKFNMARQALANLESRKESLYTGFEDDMRPFRDSLVIENDDPRYKKVSNAIWGDKKFDDNDNQLEWEEGRITKESFENSVFGAIIKSLDGKTGYIDYKGHRIPLPKNLGDVKFEKGEDGKDYLVEENMPWLMPLKTLIWKMRSGFGDPEELIREYQKEYEHNIFSKDSASFEKVMKAYGGPDMFNRVTSFLLPAFNAMGGDKEAFRDRYMNAALANIDDISKVFRTIDKDAGETVQGRAAQLEQLFARQIEGIKDEKSRDEAAQALQKAKDGFSSPEFSALSKKDKEARYRTYIDHLSKWIARTGNQEDAWFNEKGISGAFEGLRFPENLGFLQRATAVFTTTNAVAQGAVALGPALQELEHADFDGDHFRAVFTAAAATAKMTAEGMRQAFDELSEAEAILDNIYKPIGEKKIADVTKDSEAAAKAAQKGLEVEQQGISFVLNKDNEIFISELMKESKSLTGQLTNKNFNLTEWMKRKGVQNVGIDQKDTQFVDYLASVIMNTVTSNVPQSSISAKKIFRNLTSGWKMGADSLYLDKEGNIKQDLYRRDYDHFLELYSDEATWKDERARNQMLKLGAQLGLYGGKTEETLFDEGRTGTMTGSILREEIKARAKQKGLSGAAAEKYGASLLMSTFGWDPEDKGNIKKAKAFLNGDSGDFELSMIQGAAKVFDNAVKTYGNVNVAGRTIDLSGGASALFGTPNRLMPGAQPDGTYASSITHGGTGAMGGAGGGKEMSLAADKLSKAADALLRFAEMARGKGSGGAGGGISMASFSSYDVREQLEKQDLNIDKIKKEAEDRKQSAVDQIAAMQKENKDAIISEELKNQAAGKHAKGFTSASTYLKLIFPWLGEITDDSGFEKALETRDPSDFFGYDKEAFEKLRKDYFLHAQGNVVGSLAQLYEETHKAGLNDADFMLDDKFMSDPEKAWKQIDDLLEKIKTFRDSANEREKALYDIVYQEGEQGIAEPLEENRKRIDKMYGTSPEELSKARKILSMRASGLTRLPRQMLDALGGKARYLGSEHQLIGVDARGESIGARSDLMYEVVDENGDSHVVFIDTKSVTDDISPHNIAQQTLIQGLGEEELAYLRDKGRRKDTNGAWIRDSNGRYELRDFQDLLNTKHGFREFVEARGITEEQYKAFANAASVKTFIAAMSAKGTARPYFINMRGIGPEIFEAIAKTRAGEMSTEELKKRLSVAAEKMTDPGLYGKDGTPFSSEELVNELLGMADPSRERALTADEKKYRGLIREYNKYGVNIASDKISMNKTTNRLEKQSLALRIQDTEELQEDLLSQIKSLEEGLDPEMAGKIQEAEKGRAKVAYDSALVRNKGITNLWDSLSASFKNMMQRFTQMGLAYSILNKLKQGLAQVVQNAKQLDKVMTNLRIVTGYSREDARGLIASYADLATQLSSTTAEVATSAQEWLRQGYQVSEVNKLVTSSIQLSVLGMMSASDATKALTSAMKGFKMEASEVNDIVDKFTTLDMSAATTAGDIATALSQFAATAQMSGVSIDQAAAMATTIMDVSQKDAGATGNAIKTMLSRFGNVKAGTFAGMAEGDSDETTDKINDIERVLNTLGIQVRSSAREMRDFDDVLADIAAKWDHLDKVSQNAIATALAGTRQRESFAVLMNNYEKYQEFLEISQNSEGTAEEKYASYVESLEASQKRIQAAWEDFANNSGIAEFLTHINNFFSGAVKNWLPSVFKWLTKIFVLLNSYKLPAFAKAFFSPGGRGKSFLSGLTSEGFSERAKKTWESGDFGKFGDKVAYTSKNKVIEAKEKAKDAAQDAATANAATQATNALNEVANAANKGADAEKRDADETIKHSQVVKEDKNAIKEKAQQTKGQGNVPGDPNVPANDGRQPKGDRRRLRKAGFSKANAMMAATGAVMDIAAGITSSQQGFNWANWGGGLQEASSTANGWATANSTISNIGYAWGPIVGMITTTAADLLNKLIIIPLIDREANERKARVEQANKLYSQINGIGGAISELVGYAKQEYLSAEDSAEMTEKLYSLLIDYYKTDTEAQQSVEKYLIPYLDAQLGPDASMATLYDVVKSFEEGTKEQREIIVRALQYAQQEASLEQKQNTREEELVKNRDKIQDALRTLFDDFSIERLSNGDINRVLTILSNDIPSGRDMLGRPILGGELTARDIVAILDEKKNSLNPEEKEFYTKFYELYGKVTQIAAAEQAALDVYNRQLIANAILITEVKKFDQEGNPVYDGTLLSKNLDELKNIGSEEIIRLIGEKVYEMGGLNGESLYINDDKNNGFTEKAISLISQAIKADPTLSAIISHSAYSISDLTHGDWSNRQKEFDEISEDFATALHMTSQEFEKALKNGSLAQEFGNITLGDLLKTPEEIRGSMEGLSNIFQSLSNNTFLTAENLENIINKYPSLIKYLGDNNGLLDAIVKNIGELARVYTTKIYDQLVSNTEFARQFKDELYQSGEYDTEALRSAIGGAENLKQIIDTLELGPEKLGLSQDDFDRLVEQIKGLFDKIDVGSIFMRQIATDTFIPYLDMKLDRQLESLNKQKEALQQINKQREYENKLIEARNKLEEASKEKKRVWREGVGWVYEADQNALAEAQKNLEEVENERQVRELDIMIDQVNATKELVKAIQDDAKLKALEDAMNAMLGGSADQYGINGLIAITKGLYNGEDSIGEMLPGISEELSELKTKLSDLIDKEFTPSYNDSTTLKELFDRADSSLPEVRREAEKELHDRGFVRNEQGGWNFSIPKEANADTLKAAKEAYDVASNKEEIASWLDEHNYVYDEGSKTWRSPQDIFKTEDKDKLEETWIKADSPLDKGLPHYKNIEQDFYTNRAAVYVKDADGVYKWKGDIKPEDSSYDFTKWLRKNPGTIINGWYGDREFAYVGGDGTLYALKRQYQRLPGFTAAHGSLGLPGGPALINELGTEAIVTPYGTVTSLPSGTGVVPADITKNLWELGEVAPSIAQLLNPVLRKGELGALGDSFNVQNMVVNMNPNESFDVDRFVTELKSAVALRKNS